MKTLRLIPFAAVATLMLAACSTPAPQSGPASGLQSGTQSEVNPEQTLTVLASFYPLQYLTERIGDDLVTVESLTPAGAEPHDLELSPMKVAEIGRADAVVYLSGFQSAVDQAIEQNPPTNVIDVAPAVQLHQSMNTEEEPESGHVEDGHDEDAHDHDHDGTDPHFWLDPQRMAQAATAIGQSLAKADPENAQKYTAKAASVAKDMNDLSTDLVSGTATCEHRTFVTSHEAFGYLAERTRLTQLAIAGLDPDSSPSPARLKEISDAVKAEGITTIFTEELIDPKIAQTLADDLGIKTDVLDPIESQADPDRDSIAVMRANLEALRTALTCQ